MASRIEKGDRSISGLPHWDRAISIFASGKSTGFSPIFASMLSTWPLSPPPSNWTMTVVMPALARASNSAALLAGRMASARAACRRSVSAPSSPMSSEGAQTAWRSLMSDLQNGRKPAMMAWLSGWGRLGTEGRAPTVGCPLCPFRFIFSETVLFLFSPRAQAPGRVRIRVRDRSPPGPKPLAGSVHDSPAPKADAPDDKNGTRLIVATSNQLFESEWAHRNVPAGADLGVALEKAKLQRIA